MMWENIELPYFCELRLPSIPIHYIGLSSPPGFGSGIGAGRYPNGRKRRWTIS
jgi:hypothetical protein